MNKVEHAQVGVGDLGIVGVGCVGGGGVCYNALESRAANAKSDFRFCFPRTALWERAEKKLKMKSIFQTRFIPHFKVRKRTLGDVILSEHRCPNFAPDFC